MMNYTGKGTIMNRKQMLSSYALIITVSFILGFTGCQDKFIPVNNTNSDDEYALHFNGMGYVDLGSIFSETQSQPDFLTFEAWVKPDLMNTPSINPIIRNAVHGIWMGYSPTDSWTIVGFANAYQNVTHSNTRASRWNDSNWFHVAFTADYVKKIIRLYIDGQAVDSTLLSTLWLPTTEYPLFQIGASDSGTLGVTNPPSPITSSFFNGKIDEVRVWKTVRTQAEIQGSMDKHLTGSEPNLVAYYPFDEGTGMQAKNKVGSNHGQLRTVGSAGTEPSWVKTTFPH